MRRPKGSLTAKPNSCSHPSLLRGRCASRGSACSARLKLSPIALSPRSFNCRGFVQMMRRTSKELLFTVVFPSDISPSLKNRCGSAIRYRRMDLRRLLFGPARRPRRGRADQTRGSSRNRNRHDVPGSYKIAVTSTTCSTHRRLSSCFVLRTMSSAAPTNQRAALPTVTSSAGGGHVSCK